MRRGAFHREAPRSYFPAMPEPDTGPEGPGAALHVDATGWRCPMPVLLMERALRKLAPGGRLVITADDPVAAIDIPHFCAAAGHGAEATDRA